MKRLVMCATAVITCYNVYAQKPLFIRVYGADKHLVAKGYLCNGTDSTADVCRRPGHTPLKISAKDIWVIKTKHTAAHSLLVGTTVGFAAGTLAGLITPNKPTGFLVFDRGTSTAIGAIAGTGYGSIFGATAMLFRHSKTFVIKGDLVSWQAAQKAILANE